MRSAVSAFALCIVLFFAGLHTLSEGNCGRLSVLGGLKIEETVKVALNGWIEDEEDLLITLVTDGTPAVAKLREADTKQALTSQQRGGHGSAGQQAEIFDDAQPLEKAAVPLVGVRIPGTKSGKQAAVLLYRSDVNKPTEFPLDTPASHQSALMFFFSQSTSTEMRVAVYTWLPK
uniref:Microneme protein 2 n=1 Tax=Eimeria magna TaxID=471282 RepID=A0A976XI48_9EIME|nr:microneme protein 2 [Eimeria magna]